MQLRGIVSAGARLLDLRYARNAGAFFSLGAGLGPVGVARYCWWPASWHSRCSSRCTRRVRTAKARLRCALVLLASGAVGNLIDRVRNGQVIDFLHLHVGAVLHWATFNVADVLITFGLLLLLFEQIRPQAAAAGVAQGAR